MSPLNLPSDPIRVLAADDHQLLRTALCELLDAEPDLTVVAQAGSGLGLAELVRRHRPHVLLLDVEMPHSHPKTTVRSLLEACPDLRIIILTMFDDQPLVQELLQLGARGYLHKSVPREALLAAIRNAVHEEDQVTISVPRGSFTAGQDQGHAPSMGAVSPREREVLVCVAEAMSNRQIAGRLGITEGTVKRHLRNIFEKLAAVSRIDAVNKARAQGLIGGPRARSHR
ncbi:MULTISPECIES: response regulator transcription factor [unclassified Streptomyces]|uniref:response regulator n=1 Tax=unclassified Streptomyces TaxID=2593676 RepID=UPI00278C08DF|nr:MULTISPECIES: response regulator transcription factor [unclassified Streptomyces]